MKDPPSIPSQSEEYLAQKTITTVRQPQKEDHPRHRRETHHPSSIVEDAPLSSYQTNVLCDKSSSEPCCCRRQSNIVCPSALYLKDCEYHCKEQTPPRQFSRIFCTRLQLAQRCDKANNQTSSLWSAPLTLMRKGLPRHLMYLAQPPKWSENTLKGQQSWMSLRHIASLRCLVTLFSQDCTSLPSPNVLIVHFCLFRFKWCRTRQSSQDVTCQCWNSLDSVYSVRRRFPWLGRPKVRGNQVAFAYCTF